MPYEYKVVEVREKMIGGKMSGDKLEKLLNEGGRQGWQLRAMTSTEVKGRLVRPPACNETAAFMKARRNPGLPSAVCFDRSRPI